LKGKGKEEVGRVRGKRKEGMGRGMEEGKGRKGEAGLASHTIFWPRLQWFTQLWQPLYNL